VPVPETDGDDRQAELEPIMAPARELEVLQEAAWLFEDEFGADVVVRKAADEDDLAGKAKPGKPAIHIS